MMQSYKLEESFGAQDARSSRPGRGPGESDYHRRDSDQRQERDGLDAYGVRHTPLPSYEYGSECTQTYDWDNESDRAYYEFLKKFGHIDFSLIGFVPEIDLAEEVESVQAQLQQKEHVEHAHMAIDFVVDCDLDENLGRNSRSRSRSPRRRKKKKKKIRSRKVGEEQLKNLIADTERRIEKLAEELEPGEKCKVNRFDFTFNNHYFVNNIQIEDDGVRISSMTTLQGRVVSHHAITSDIQFQDGRRKTSRLARKILKSKYYFQYRIDELLGGVQNPRICIGLCQDDFLVN